MTKWTRCRDCGTYLTNSESRSIGYGRDCARKRGLKPPKRRRSSTRPARRPKPATVPPAPDALPGQTEIPLVFHQPTLESL